MAGESVTMVLQGGADAGRVPAGRQPVAHLRKALGRLYASAEKGRTPIVTGLAAELLDLSGGFAPSALHDGARAETQADRVLADMAQDSLRRRGSPVLPLLLRGAARTDRVMLDALTDLKADATRPKPAGRP